MEYSIFDIVSQKLVKPSTSTPPSLRCYKLCLNDQIECSYIPLAFFYPNQQASDAPIESHELTSQNLETALSKTLSYYYPFAGRLRDNLFIECNDMGAYFTVAEFKCQMTELDKPQSSIMKALALPNSFLYLHDGDGSLLHIQLNYFQCGGMAVSICLSHKAGDISTLFTFFNDWATMVHHPNHIPTPQFIGVSLFPPIEDPSLVKEISMKEIRSPGKYLLFRAPKIAQLKDLVAKSNTCGVDNPTRVEVVTALLYKSALDSSKEISSGSFIPSGLVLTMNLRPMTDPPLPKEAVGNISVGVVIPTPKEEEITLSQLVSKIRNMKVNIKNEYKEAKTNYETPSVKLAMNQMNHQGAMSNNQLDIYVCSSWCGHQFYDVDFGRGKPTGVYFPDQGGAKNVFILRDARNKDGIEVLAMLEEPQMSAFVTNQDLLAFATLSA